MDDKKQKHEPAESVIRLYERIESIKSVMSMANGERPELWIQRQNLLDLYHQIILRDLDFIIDKKVEQDLWNQVFKSQISYFQSQIKQKKPDAHVSLTLLLESARGFYTKLLEDLIIVYNLDEDQEETSPLAALPFSSRFRSIKSIKSTTTSSSINDTTREKQILYIFQHVLTHLGDLARYSNYFAEAKNYYLHAVRIVPYLGQSYNQLGILFETMRTSQMAAVFYYIRSIAIRYTFPLASTNLENFYLKLIDIPLTRYNPNIKESDLSNTIKSSGKSMAHKDLLTLFLQINGIVYTCLYSGPARSSKLNSLMVSNFNNAANKLNLYYELFKCSFASFMQTTSVSLSKERLDSTLFCQMISIIIFSLGHHKVGTTTTTTQQAAVQISLSMFVFVVEQFVSYFNTNLKDGGDESIVLPSLYVAFQFIETYNDGYIVQENRLFTLTENSTKFGSAMVSMMNKLNSEYLTESEKAKQELVDGFSFDCNSYNDYPLTEDCLLNSFLLLKDWQSQLSFRKYANTQLDEKYQSVLRRKRIVEFFERLVDKIGDKFYVQKRNDETGVVKFFLNPAYSQEPETSREINKTERQQAVNIVSNSSKQSHVSFPTFQPMQTNTTTRPALNQPHSFFPSASTRQTVQPPVSQPTQPSPVSQSRNVLLRSAQSSRSSPLNYADNKTNQYPGFPSFLPDPPPPATLPTSATFDSKSNLDHLIQNFQQQQQFSSIPHQSNSFKTTQTRPSNLMSSNSLFESSNQQNQILNLLSSMNLNQPTVQQSSPWAASSLPNVNSTNFNNPQATTIIPTTSQQAYTTNNALLQQMMLNSSMPSPSGPTSLVASLLAGNSGNDPKLNIPSNDISNLSSSVWSYTNTSSNSNNQFSQNKRLFDSK